MHKPTRNTSGGHPRTQLADYFGTLADTLEWNPDAWRALCASLLAPDTPVGDLTLRQIHACIHEIREGEHAPTVFPQPPRHLPEPGLAYVQGGQGDAAPDCPTTPAIRRARVSAGITLQVNEDSIVLSGLLDMGGLMVRSTRGWRRIPDGWTLTSGPVFFRDHEDLLGRELAEYLGNLPLPLALADALQEPRGGEDEEAGEA